MESITIVLGEDSIYTNATGIKQMLAFYTRCKNYTDSSIEIALDNVNWIDGNLCAFWGSLLYKLNKENNLSFILNSEQVEQKCNVLFHNEFLPIKQSAEKAKEKSSCIPFRSFRSNEKDKFISYLTDELLVHEGMPKFTNAATEKIVEDLSEISGNIHRHAGTNYPFFVCGQYFPKKGTVNFTISDLGEGFYPKIKAAQPDLINNDGDAILWAVNGNSTKKDAPGGQGLKNLKNYFNESNGAMHIFTGKNGWLSDQSESALFKDGIMSLPDAYFGTAINLVFNKKSLSLYQ